MFKRDCNSVNSQNRGTAGLLSDTGLYISTSLSTARLVDYCQTQTPITISSSHRHKKMNTAQVHQCLSQTVVKTCEVCMGNPSLQVVILHLTLCAIQLTRCIFSGAGGRKVCKNPYCNGRGFTQEYCPCNKYYQSGGNNYIKPRV